MLRLVIESSKRLVVGLAFSFHLVDLRNLRNQWMSFFLLTPTFRKSNLER
jgi:hypothetical protein